MAKSAETVVWPQCQSSQHAYGSGASHGLASEGGGALSGQQTKLQTWQNSQPASWADVKEREPPDQLLRIVDFAAAKGVLVAASKMTPTKRAAIATRDNRTF